MIRGCLAGRGSPCAKRLVQLLLSVKFDAFCPCCLIRLFRFFTLWGLFWAVCRKLCKSVELERAQTPFTQESRYRPVLRPMRRNFAPTGVNCVYCWQGQIATDFLDWGKYRVDMHLCQLLERDSDASAYRPARQPRRDFTKVRFNSKHVT
jgi:hypothetical protein